MQLIQTYTSRKTNRSTSMEGTVVRNIWVSKFGVVKNPLYVFIYIIGVLFINNGNKIFIIIFVYAHSWCCVCSCTLLLGTPTMYVDLCNHIKSLGWEEKRRLQTPEVGVTGGAICPIELCCKIKDTFSLEYLLVSL